MPPKCVYLVRKGLRCLALHMQPRLSQWEGAETVDSKQWAACKLIWPSEEFQSYFLLKKLLESVTISITLDELHRCTRIGESNRIICR